MRLFFAVDVDPSTRSTIWDISTALQRLLSDVRITWVRPERMHLTIAFLGEADAVLQQRAVASLEQSFPIAPFDLHFDGIGVFPTRGLPRVLWLGVKGGAADLPRMRDELSRRLGRHAAPNDLLHPHLTLGRFRARATRAEVTQALHVAARAGPCRIDRVTLYESRLSPRGPSYLALASAALTPCI